MLAHLEAIDVLNHTVLALIVNFVTGLQLFQNLNFDICIINIELFILTYFGRYNSLLGIFAVFTFYHLAKGSSIYDPHDFVAPCKLFTWLDHIETFPVRNRVLILPSNLANGIYAFIHAHFNSFKLCQLVAK